MFRRLLTAALFVAALLADRVTAKPPDLPLPQNDVLAPETPAPAEVGRPAAPDLMPPDAAPTPEPSLFFRVRPSVRRTMTSCLLFGVDPLLALAPTEEYVDFDEDDAPNTALLALFDMSAWEKTNTESLTSVGVNSGVTPAGGVKYITLDMAVALASHGEPQSPQQLFPRQDAKPDDSTPSVCPWMREQQCGPDRHAVVSADIDLSHDVLDNLEMLRQAHELLRDAREFGRAGQILEALDCLEQAHELCPNVWLDEKIQEASAEVFACSYCASARGDMAADEQSEPPAKETFERRLSRPVTLNFNKVPLSQVIDDIRATQGINIYVDKAALDAEEVSLDTPITIKLEMIPLKSALHLILKSARLNFVVKDEVLQITTERVAAPFQPVSYQVGELIIPVQEEAAYLRPCLPPVDPQVPAALDGLYPETSDPVQLDPAGDEEQEPPADILKGAAKPFVQAADLEKVGCVKDGGAPMSCVDVLKEFAALVPPEYGELAIGPDGGVRVFTQVRHGATVWHMLYENGALSVWASPDGGADANEPAENPPDDGSGD